jgi:hypothetical protein
MTANMSNRVRGIPILPGLPTHIAMTQGNIYHVMPYSGSDSNDGLSVDSPIKTLDRAQTLATANQNDVVLFYCEGYTAAMCTDYQAAMLTWAKNAVHLIGVGPGNGFANRCRVGFASAYDAASPLFYLTANNCYIENMFFYVGVAGVSTLGSVSITGDYNHFKNCHIAGMGASTNVVTGAYSLLLTGADGNKFEDCIIGYTQQRGAAVTTEISFAGNSGKNTFKECTLLMSNGTDATSSSFVTVAAHGLAEYVLFDHCKFLNCGINAGGANITYAFKVNADPMGTILLDYCSSAGVTDWHDDSGFIWGPTLEKTNGASTGGIGIVLIKT